MITDMLIDAALSAIAGIGFGAISYPPRRSFKYIALLAASGHTFRFFLMNYLNIDIATSSFAASLLIGLLSLWFGKLSYCPLTVLYIPALLPMIPGMYAYKSVFALVMLMHNLKDYTLSERYMHELMVNTTVTFSVVFLLAVGATVFIFLFPRKAYSMTRRI